jgi:hypothetical protein
VSDDPRYVVIDGRRWRATDPGIPERLRAVLVAELRSAHRAVATGGDVAEARRRVQDAKVALGERGEPWWEPASPDGRAARLTAAMQALLRHRASTSTICPSDAARVVAGDRFRSAMDEARRVAGRLREAGVVRTTQKGEDVDPLTVRGPLRIGRGPQWRD